MFNTLDVGYIQADVVIDEFITKPNLLPGATGYGWESSRDDRELLLFALIREIRDDQRLVLFAPNPRVFLKTKHDLFCFGCPWPFVPPILLGTGVTLAWFAGKVFPGIVSLLHKQQAAFTWLNDLSVGELYSAQPVFLLARKISCSQFFHTQASYFAFNEALCS